MKPKDRDKEKLMAALVSATMHENFMKLSEAEKRPLAYFIREALSDYLRKKMKAVPKGEE